MAAEGITDYLNEIARYPVLTKEAQLRHCRRVQEWITWPGGRDKAPRSIQIKGKRSMNIMISTNLRLVVSVAKRYQNRGLDLSDLIQEGTLGLMRGIELFDPTRGYALSTYSFWWIRQAITRALHTYSRLIRIPINVQENLSRIQKFRAQFYLANGRYPTATEAGAHLGLPPERVLQLLDVNQVTDCASLDVPAIDRGSNIVDLIPNDDNTVANDPEQALQHELTNTFVQEALNQLPEPERYIVESSLLNNRSMRDLAAELDMTRSRIATLRQNGLRRLKVHMIRSRLRG